MHRAAGWTFPSPGQTPTTASFDASIFQTPKTLVYPSHFQEAFRTPHVPGYATPQQAEYTTMTPLQRSFLPVETLRSNADAEGRPFGDAANMLHGLPQTMPAAFPSAEAHVLPSNDMQWAAALQQSATNMTFDSQQMQTPPPTRDASAKRLPPGPHVAFGTPSTIASRRMVTPQNGFLPDSAAAVLPPGPPPQLQFPYLQFSQDAYQFGNGGPATAPVLSQAQGQVLWAQQTSPQHTFAPNTPQPLLADPFAPGAAPMMMWPSMAMQSGVPNMNFQGAPMGSDFPVQATPQTRPASAIPFVPSSVPSSVVPSTAGVDPSLVYSSPVRADAEPVSHSRNNATPASRAEPSSATRTTASAPAKPLLRRSNTTGLLKTSSNLSPLSNAADAIGRSQSSLLPPRVGSPLKRTGKPLDAISESRKPRARTSVILTIDDSGRARTETRVVDAPDSPTRSARAKYPGLFDTDSSDDEDAGAGSDDEPSDEDRGSLSRQASFRMDSRSDLRRSFKAARRDDVSSDDSHGLHPRGAAAAVAAAPRISPSRASIAAAAQLRRGNSIKRKSLVGRGPASAVSDRPTPQRSFSESVHGLTLADHNRRWSCLSIEQSLGLPTASQQFASPETSPQAHAAEFSFQQSFI